MRTVQKDIQNGSLKNHSLLPQAVVGIVDIVGSTRISNSVDLFTGWDIKERFFECANNRAKENGIVILNSTGDGFLFLANYQNGQAWVESLIRFYEKLTEDFAGILETCADSNYMESGLRWGISAGPIVLGWMGAHPDALIAAGPDIDLAARLCALAGTNEMVLSSRVSQMMSDVLKRYEQEKRVCGGLKGFNDDIPVVRVYRNETFECSADVSRIAA